MRSRTGHRLAALFLAAASLAPARPAGAQAAPAAPAAVPPARPWQPGDPIPSLARAYRGEFLVGAAITSAMVLAADVRPFLERQFDVVVAENEMKPLALEPREGEFNFGPADAIVDWAVAKGIKVRGHCLVWHEEAPAWMFVKDGQPAPRELVVQRLRTYIQTVVGHFKGRVWAWDVVNEALVVSEPSVPSVDGWRKSPWYDALGPDYVTLAFQFAHEADPGALLFYNDYETQNPAKRALVLALIRSLQAKAVAIHGVGHQVHYQLSRPDPSELAVTFEEVARLGLRNQVTELDVSLCDRWGDAVPPVTSELLARQARRYAQLFHLFRQNRDKVEAVLLWGVNDETSWLRPPDGPLLFRGFQPKPAFWAVLAEARRRLE